MTWPNLTAATLLKPTSLQRIQFNLGYRHGPSDIIDAISRGEQVDPDSEIMRTHARLGAGDPHFYWVNKTLFVGTVARNAGHVQIELYALR